MEQAVSMLEGALEGRAAGFANSGWVALKLFEGD